MIVKEHYDVIVVGADLAPLLAAALLCKRGFRVLVVGAGEPAEDSVPAVTGDLESPVARRILAELGITQVIRRKEQPLDPCFQIITSRARVSIGGDRERLLAEFGRELPREREAARVFYADLENALESIDGVLESGAAIPPRGFIERQRVRRLLGATPFGVDGLGGRLLGALQEAPGLRTCVFANVVPRSRLDRRQIAPVHAALLHGRAVRGQVAIEGGIKALKDLLLHKIATSRGETKLVDRVEEIAVRRGRVLHVKLEGHESATGCDFLLGGVAMTSIARLMRQEGRRYDERVTHGPDPSVEALVATARIVVRDEVLPEPMARLVYVLFDEGQPPFEANLAVIERGSGGEAGTAVLRVSFLVDHLKAVHSRRYVTDVFLELRGRLRWLVPFLEDFVVDQREPLDSITDEELEEDAAGALTRHLEPIYGTRDAGPWGACGQSFGTRLRNLVVCSREVLPGLGSEGQWLTAWGAAGLVASRDPAKARWQSKMSRL